MPQSPPSLSLQSSTGQRPTLWLTQARRAGLLSLLGAEHWHLLCAVLSFTDRDGRRRFSLDQLGSAAALAPDTARQRLTELAAVPLRGEALLHLDCDPEGEVIGATLAAHPLFAAELPPAPREQNNSLHSWPVGNAALPAELSRQLEELCLTTSQIDWLASRFPETRIRWQLAWLPERQPRNPAAMLVRAIVDDWPPPQAWKSRDARTRPASSFGQREEAA